MRPIGQGWYRALRVSLTSGIYGGHSLVVLLPWRALSPTSSCCRTRNKLHGSEARSSTPAPIYPVASDPLNPKSQPWIPARRHELRAGGNARGRSKGSRPRETEKWTPPWDLAWVAVRASDLGQGASPCYVWFHRGHSWAKPRSGLPEFFADAPLLLTTVAEDPPAMISGKDVSPSFALVPTTFWTSHRWVLGISATGGVAPVNSVGGTWPRRRAHTTGGWRGPWSVGSGMYGLD
jgi:hypothetical protein